MQVFLRFAAMFFAALGLVSESALFFVWWEWKDLMLSVMVHAVAVLCLAVFFWLRKRSALKLRDEWNAIHFFAFLLILFFPIVGLFGTLLYYVNILLRERLKGGIYDDFQSHIHERTQSLMEIRSLTRMLSEMRDEVSFEPLVDIMSGKTAPMKVRAIFKLAQMVSPASVKLLLEARNDPSAEVRLHAASAILKIEGKISDKIQKALRTAKKQNTAIAFADLGDLYYTYSESGLLNHVMTLHYLKMGADAYQNSIDIETNQPRVIVRFGSCMMKTGSLDKAKMLVNHGLKLWPKEKSIIFLRNEIYFKMGLFEDIGKTFDVLNESDLEYREKEVCQFWKS